MLGGRAATPLETDERSRARRRRPSGRSSRSGSAREPHADLVDPGGRRDRDRGPRARRRGRSRCPTRMVEIWQADGEGRYAGASAGAAAAPTPAGRFALHDRQAGPSRPGRRPGPARDRARLRARAAQAGADAALLRGRGRRPTRPIPCCRAIADDGERATLIAGPNGEASYRFDVKLQGEGQTVFFTTPAWGL